MGQGKGQNIRMFSPNATEAFSNMTGTNQLSASGLIYKMKAKTNRYKINNRNKRE
jgi:hypothetical protein